MKKAIITLSVIGALGTGLLLNDSHDSHQDEHHGHEDEHSQEKSVKVQTGLVSPIPHDQDYNAPLASLGFTLFNDPKLSSNGKVSCASCHNLATNGAEITLSPPE